MESSRPEYLCKPKSRSAGSAKTRCLQAGVDRHRTLTPFDEAADLDVAPIRFWNQDIVLVNRADLIHTVLVTEADAFRKGPLLTRQARPLLGQGLLTSDNDLNRSQRRIISPAFAHRKIGDYAGTIIQKTRRISATWPDNTTIDVPTEALNITLAVTGQLMFGEDLGGWSDGILGALPRLMNFAIDQLRSPWRAVLSVPAALQALMVLNRSLSARIVARRRRGRPDSDEDLDLLDVLLFGHGDDAAAKMPDRLVRDETMTVFLAGIETVAMALAWAFYLLTTHPTIYDRVQTEVDGIGEDVSPKAVIRAPLTLQVFKEALRLYPPAYILARQAIREVAVGPHVLPRGAVVFISPYLRQRRPEVFENPLEFDPDRWSAPNFERNLPKYAYMPFGGGPHVCIGGHFAMMQGHLILAQLLKMFRFELIPNQTIVPEPLFTLRPLYGIEMRVNRRPLEVGSP